MAQPQSSPSAATTTTVSSNSRTAVSKTPGLESLQTPATFVNWEGEEHLHIYMIDYCRKRGFSESVKAISNETKLPAEVSVPMDAPQGFLFEWWVVHWEIFKARREQPSRRPVEHDAAAAYVHAQRKGAELRQQQQQHEVQMRANAQQQATSLWTAQGPPGEYGRQLLSGVTRPGYPTAAQIQGLSSNPSMPGQYPTRMNGISPGGTNPQIPQQVRPYGQAGQLNPTSGLGAPQNTGPPPQHGQPSQMTQVNIANAHKFAQSIHAPGTQAAPQQPQQPGAQPHPTPNYQQSTLRGMYSGPSPQMSHANPSPLQNNPNSNLPQHPQQPVQQNYNGMNPASHQPNLIRQTSQPTQQQQQHPQSHGIHQAREPTPRPSLPQISTNPHVPASHPHSTSSTPAPNQQNNANAQGQPSPNRDAIAPRPRSQPQPQNAQQGGYPVVGQYGSGPGGVFTQPSQPGMGQSTMSTLGLAGKKDQGEGGPEIDGQGQSGPQKVAAPTRSLGRMGSVAPASFMTPTVGPNAPSGSHQPQPQLPGGSLPLGHAQVGMKRPGSPTSQYAPDRNQDASTPDHNKRPRRGSVSSERINNPPGNPPNNPGQTISNPPTPGYPSYSAGPYGPQNRTPIAYTQRPGPHMQQMNAAQRISAPAPGIGGANSSFARPSQNQAPSLQNPPQPQQGLPPQPSQQQQPAPQQATPANSILGSDPNRHGSLNTDAQAQVATLSRPVPKPRISGLGSIGGAGVGRGTFIPSSPSMVPTVVGSKGMMPPPQTPGTTTAAPPGAPKEKEESMSLSLSEAQNDISTAITASPMIKNIEGAQKPSTPAPLSAFPPPSISPVASTSNPPTSAVSGSAPTPVAEHFPFSIVQPSGPAPLAFDLDDYSEYGGMTNFSSGLGFEEFLNDFGTGNGADMDDVGVIS